MRRLLGTCLMAALMMAITIVSAGAETGPFDSSDCERIGKGARDRSRDGRYEVFATSAALVTSDTNTACDIYLKDRKTDQLRRISVSSDGSEARVGVVLHGESSILPHSIAPRFSRDESRIRFLSAASDLVPNDTNFSWDLFIHDLKTGLTKIR